MPSIAQRSLAGGELAPALGARAEQAKYQSGLKTCRNFEIMREGGVQNRPGTGFVHEQKSSAERGKLAHFVFNADQTYALLFENLCMRVIQNGVMLESPPGTVYEIVTPYVTADLPLLNFSQSGDVITITHRSYAIRELSRTGHTAWTLTTLVTAPLQQAPTSVTTDGAVGGNYNYIVTAIAAETYEESIASNPIAGTSTAPTTGSPVNISWVAAPGAIQYNVYKEKNGVYGFIGIAVGLTFKDDGILPDTSTTSPQAREPFLGAGNFPATSAYWQQRHMFANTLSKPETIWGSKTGNTKNFSISQPLQDDDAVTFALAGSQIQAVQHMLSLGQFIVLTSSGEWVIQGDAAGVLTAVAPNAKQDGYTGASSVTPVVIGNNAIYVQARGSIIRDLRFEFQSQGYNGRDLSVFANHMFKRRTITSMDFAQVPDSIVWLVRSDGVLLGLTYLREHEIWGWHRHDTDGLYEDVVCLPEGDEDAIYVLVKRTINGVTKRYVERFHSRQFTDISIDAKFLDCGLTYDGRNLGSRTMTLSGGTTWENGDNLLLTASSSFFSAGDVGNAIVFNNNGMPLAVNITSYTSVTAVHGNPVRTVPVGLRGVAVTAWGKAVDSLTGLGHLEGKTVSILADGNVIANSVDGPLFTITAGALVPSLDRPYVVIHVGLPYVSDIETLDLDPLGGIDTVRDKPKIAHGVTLDVLDTRGLLAGEDFAHLFEAKQRELENWGDPIQPKTGKVDIPIGATWNDSGRVVLRQQDPLPATILAITPQFDIGGQTR